MPRKSAAATTRSGVLTPKSEHTRQRILDAAAVVLNRKGYAGTRLSDIAEVAEIQAPAIYHYFLSREDLVEEIALLGLNRTMAQVREALAAMPADATAMDKILAAVRAHLEMVLRDSAHASAAIRGIGQFPDAIQEKQVCDMRRYGGVWRDLIKKGIENGEIDPDLEPSAVRMLIIGALNWAPEWWNPKRANLAAIVDTAQRIVRRGLAPDLT